MKAGCGHEILRLSANGCAAAGRCYAATQAGSWASPRQTGATTVWESSSLHKCPAGSPGSFRQSVIACAGDQPARPYSIQLCEDSAACKVCPTRYSSRKYRCCSVSVRRIFFRCTFNNIFFRSVEIVGMENLPKDRRLQRACAKAKPKPQKLVWTLASGRSCHHHRKSQQPAA